MDRQLSITEWINRFRIHERERLLMILSFASVYLIWGSTYYSIKIAITTLPPFLMAATRYLIAGLILYVGARIAGATFPSVRHWKDSAVLGFFLLLMGNGGVVWASDKLPSGIIALLITVEPIWIVLLVILKHKGKLPDTKTILGILLGLAGTVILVLPDLGSQSQLSVSGLLAVFVSTVCWAIGSIYAVNAYSGISIILATAMQMLCGGAFMLIVATIRGEFINIHPEQFSMESLYAYLYLIIFGSIIGYSSYAYLLKVSSPSKVSTYAYVNPFVAVFIGTMIGNEPFTRQIGISAVLMVLGVFLVLTKNKKK